MKKILYTLLGLCFSAFLFAQTQLHSGHPIYSLNGNIGIGTNSPVSKFQVNGPVRLLHNGSGALFSDWSGSAAFYLDGSNGDFIGGDYGIIKHGPDGLQFYNGGLGITMLSNLNVGIGTTSPNQKLDVGGNIAVSTGTFYTQATAFTFRNQGGSWVPLSSRGVNTGDWTNIPGYGEFITGSNYNLQFKIQGETRLFIDKTYGNVGIGTTSPSAKLEVNPNGSPNAIGAINVNDGTTRIYAWNQSSGSNSSAQLMLNAGSSSFGDRGATIQYNSNGNILHINNTGDPNSVIAFTNRTSTNSEERMRIHLNGNVGIGTTNPTEKLSVNGNILAKKVRVSVAAADWPDYVFASTYKLRPLNELEDYIKKNEHLPEVPSAQEVETDGLDLGDMDATLLKKVEELTLYLIEQDKTSKTQAASLEEVKEENLELRKMLVDMRKEIELLKKDK